MNIFRKIVAWARAENIREIRRKRILRENIKAWGDENCDFIRREEAREWRKIKSGYYSRKYCGSPGDDNEWY